MTRLSAIVVSYNTRDALRRCLGSLCEADEVVVVDNASRDGSAEMVAAEFPDCVLVRNERNRGFGAANNQGLDVATGDYALVLNSDAVAELGALRALVSALDAQPDVAACGGRLRFPDGRLQESCCNALTLWAVFCEQTYLEKLFPRSRALSPYWTSRRLLEGHEKCQTHDVEQVMGACLMMRRVKSGPSAQDAEFLRFDERFFLYCEDTELCKRLRAHGRIVWVPDAVFAHELGASSQRRWEAVARYNRGKELYFAIHHGRLSASVCFMLDRLGALARASVWTLAAALTLFTLRRVREKAWLFAQVSFAPVSGPPLPRDTSE